MADVLSGDLEVRQAADGLNIDRPRQDVAFPFSGTNVSQCIAGKLLLELSLPSASWGCPRSPSSLLFPGRR